MNNQKSRIVVKLGGTEGVDFTAICNDVMEFTNVGAGFPRPGCRVVSGNSRQENPGIESRIFTITD